MTRSFISFDSPPPDPTGSELETWAKKLVAWLLDQRRLNEEDYEEALALGGNLVANRLFGDEGIIAAPGAAQEDEIVAAPIAGKKKIVVFFTFAIDEAAAGANTLEVQFFKKKASTEVVIGHVVLDKTTELSGSTGTLIVLDDIDESLWIRTVLNTAAEDIHWNLSWLDVD